MLELQSIDFLRAATTLARLNQILSGLSAAHQEALLPQSVAAITPAIDEFRREADRVGARYAVVHVDRTLAQLKQTPCPMTVGQALTALSEIESRFSDYMADVQMFALAPGEAIFMQSADQLIELEGFSAHFPNAAFEVEEASKCIALGRYTAAVFHAMRMLEIGIRALAKRLSIPDPTKAAEKNWGSILGSIKTRIDEVWPRQSRFPNSEGAAFEALHATLDAVRNPWRNATMHVETIYAPHEALHILRCAAYFMRRLSEQTNEAGQVVPAAQTPTLPGLEMPVPDQ